MSCEIMDRVGDILRETAAAVVMPRFASLREADVSLKAFNDPVTIADREAEAMIGRLLRPLLRGARIIGEEACAADPALLNNLDEGNVWIIDPIDGTANFAAGRRPFAMMIALLQEGRVTGSWILDPLTGCLCVAQLGGGAWAHGVRLLSKTGTHSLGQLNGIVSEAFTPAGGQVIIDWIRTAVACVSPTARCAGYEYPLIARGEQHFALYWRTLVWDHAPGVLLLTEAGGSALHLDGGPYDPARPRSGLLLTHDASIMDVIACHIKAIRNTSF